METKAMDTKMETIKKTDKVKNILFVDGDQSLIMDMKEWISNSEIETKYGLRFNYAKNAQEALKKLSEMQIDLVILEIALPLVSGYHLIKAIRAAKPDLHIIIYTRLKNSQDLAKMADTKVNNIFLKELMNFQDLIEIIRSKESAENMDVLVMELKSQIKALHEPGGSSDLKLMQCPRCNLIIAPDSHFCNNCGQKIFRKTKKLLKESPKKEKGGEADSGAEGKKEEEDKGEEKQNDENNEKK